MYDSAQGIDAIRSRFSLQIERGTMRTQTDGEIFTVNTTSEHKRRAPKLLRVTLGMLSMLLGLLLAPLPIPLGWFFLLMGLALLSMEIPWIGRFVCYCRSRWAWGDKRLRELQKISPALVKEFIDCTDPQNTESEQQQAASQPTDGSK